MRQRNQGFLADLFHIARAAAVVGIRGWRFGDYFPSMILLRRISQRRRILKAWADFVAKQLVKIFGSLAQGRSASVYVLPRRIRFHP